MKFIQLLSILLLFISTSIFAQGRFDKVEIKTTKLSDHTYMLEGAGGNIGVSVGEDGVFVIDDQFAPLSEKILTAIKALSDKPLKFLVNTHYHGDHSGGNENMTKAGATIIAHDNVKKRLEGEQRDGSFKPKEALPVITFNDKLNITINDESVAVFHVANAHTDGDALLYFTESNVLHTGDTYFNGRYPYIDLNSGGSVKGYIEAAKRGLMVIDEETKIIPGHGKLSNLEEYKGFLKMLETLRDNIQKAIDDGKTEDEVKDDSSLTKTYDDLGYGTGFINSERIRLTFYKSLNTAKNSRKVAKTQRKD
jgi:glyoxylase-like metal-dependent hydrolase (beta-lactamase superfamily II)